MAGWGGRRRLIVLGKRDGIDAGYCQWLEYFDAGIIYSFVRLSDEAMADVHARFAPVGLTLYRDHRRGGGWERSFNVRLPFAAPVEPVGAADVRRLLRGWTR